MRSPVVDAHYDLLCDVFRLRRQGERKVIERFYLDDVRASGVNVLICSLFVRDTFVPEAALRNALDQIGMLHREMEESPNLFSLCRSSAEVFNAIEAGRTAILLSFEGIEPIGNDIELLRVFYELGVRFVGLTWSRRNYAADGCHFGPVTEGSPGGLTAFGVQVLEEAERLGMIVDVSHLNDAGFADVLKFAKNAKKPFIASHSNCRAICGAARNLTDGQIEALASRGGVMGLNNMLHFVYPNGEIGEASPYGDGIPPVKIPEGKPLYDGFFDHIRHVIDLVGAEHIGFGFDLCEFEKQENERIKSIFPTYRHAVPFMEKLAREFSPDAAAKISGGNWMRIIETLR